MENSEELRNWDKSKYKDILMEDSQDNDPLLFDISEDENQNKNRNKNKNKDKNKNKYKYKDNNINDNENGNSYELDELESGTVNKKCCCNSEDICGKLIICCLAFLNFTSMCVLTAQIAKSIDSFSQLICNEKDKNNSEINETCITFVRDAEGFIVSIIFTTQFVGYLASSFITGYLISKYALKYYSAQVMWAILMNLNAFVCLFIGFGIKITPTYLQFFSILLGSTSVFTRIIEQTSLYKRFQLLYKILVAIVFVAPVGFGFLYYYKLSTFCTLGSIYYMQFLLAAITSPIVYVLCKRVDVKMEINYDKIVYSSMVTKLSKYFIFSTLASLIILLSNPVLRSLVFLNCVITVFLAGIYLNERFN